MILSTPVYQEPPADVPAAPEDQEPNACADPVWEPEHPDHQKAVIGYWLQFPTHVQMLLRSLVSDEAQRVQPTFAWELLGDLQRYPDLELLLDEEFNAEERAELLCLDPPAEVAEELEAGRAVDAGDPAERDPWRKYLQIPAAHRDGVLAAEQVPFHVLGVRRWRERSGGTRWHLLVELAPLRIVCVVRLPTGNRQRDHQLEWLQAKGEEVRELVLCMYLEPTGGKRSRVALKRTAWWNGPADRPELPAKARRLLGL